MGVNWGSIAGGASQGLNQGIRTIADVQAIQHEKSRMETEKNKNDYLMKKIAEEESPVFLDTFRQQNPNIGDNVYNFLKSRASASGLLNKSVDGREYFKKGQGKEFAKLLGTNDKEALVGAQLKDLLTKKQGIMEKLGQTKNEKEAATLKAQLDSVTQESDTLSYQSTAYVKQKELESQNTATETWSEPYSGPGGSLLQKSTRGQVRSVIGREPTNSTVTWGEPFEGPGGALFQKSSLGQVKAIEGKPTEKTGQNWILPDRTPVISYDGGRSYKDQAGVSFAMPPNSIKIPGGATLGEINIIDAKRQAAAELEKESQGEGGTSPKGAALVGTGPYMRVASAFEALAGGLGADVLIGQNGFFPQMADAKQYLRSVKQIGKAALMNSSRGAIWEQQRIDELFPDPDTTFTNPRIEARKFSNLMDVMGAEKKFNNQAIVSSVTAKEIEKYRTSNNEIDRLFELISEPAGVSTLSADDEALINKYSGQ